MNAPESKAELLLPGKQVIQNIKDFLKKSGKQLECEIEKHRIETTIGVRLDNAGKAVIGSYVIEPGPCSYRLYKSNFADLLNSSKNLCPELIAE